MGVRYPGHMAAARKAIRENLRYVDVVLEVVDARAPASTRHPDADRLFREKPRLLVLNKADLADPALTRYWLEHWEARGQPSVSVDARQGRGLAGLFSALDREAEKPAGKRRGIRRVMVAGVPNVGKSSLINRMAGRSKARTGALPGITRGKQWLRAGAALEVLDLPGILWPRLTDTVQATKLALVGVLGEEQYQAEEVALFLLRFIWGENRQAFRELFGGDPGPGEQGLVRVLEDAGRRRGCLLPGGVIDRDRAARLLVAEFRRGRLGAYTLDVPPADGFVDPARGRTVTGKKAASGREVTAGDVTTDAKTGEEVTTARKSAAARKRPLVGGTQPNEGVVAGHDA